MKTDQKSVTWFGVAVALVLTACAGIGAVRSNPEVDRSFRNLTVSPDYGYWYLNLEDNPYAVVGLQRDWRIEDIHWHPVDPRSPTFRKVVGLVEGFPAPGLRTYGGTLVDPQGNPIGIWYSSLIPGVRVDAENKLVTLSTATPWMQGPDGSNGGRE